MTMPRNSGKSSQSGSGSSLPSTSSNLSNSDSNTNIHQQVQANYTPQRFPAQPPTNQPGKPNAAKIESIKSYYYQLSASLRSVTAQLQQPDLTPGRRQALGLQQEKLQCSLSEFTEKVLKPLMAAARSGTPPAHIDSGLQQLGGSQPSQPPISTHSLSQQSYTQSHSVQQPHPHMKQYPIQGQSQQPSQPQNMMNKSASRHLALANQHFQDAQQQQLAFQQRLQARATVAAAANSNYYAAYQQNGSRPQSPYMQRPPPPPTMQGTASPAMSHLSRATSLQRLSSSQNDLQIPSLGLASQDGSMYTEMIINSAEQREKPKVKLADLFPDWPVSRQQQCLEVLDDVIDKIAEQAIQYTVHQGNEYMSERDLALAIEDVLGPTYTLPKYSYHHPPPPVVKRPTMANNLHNSRMAQIRKDIATMAAKSRQ